MEKGFCKSLVYSIFRIVPALLCGDSFFAFYCEKKAVSSIYCTSDLQNHPHEVLYINDQKVFKEKVKFKLAVQNTVYG